MTDDQLNKLAIEFRNKDSVSVTEFRAWIAGFVAAIGDTPLSADHMDLILALVLKLVPDKQPTPSTPQTPYIPPGPIPRISNPWEPLPLYLRPSPIWLEQPMVATNTSYNIPTNKLDVSKSDNGS